jgi:hypothetical protein
MFSFFRAVFFHNLNPMLQKGAPPKIKTSTEIDAAIDIDIDNEREKV